METSALPAFLPLEVIWVVIPDTELKGVPHKHIFISRHSPLHAATLIEPSKSVFLLSPLLLATTIPFHTMCYFLSLSDSESIMTSDNYRMLMLLRKSLGFGLSACYFEKE